MTREQYENWKRERALAIKRRRRKITTIALALMIAVGATIGTTVAWLTDSTDPVQDTFTYGDVDIKLVEGAVHDSFEEATLWSQKEKETGNTITVTGRNNSKLLPGDKLAFDPYVMVDPKSEACWLFIELELSENFDEFMLHKINSGWEEVDSTKYPNVWYMEWVPTSDNPANCFSIFGADNSDDELWGDNQIFVKTTVTKDALDSLNSDSQPWIKITAYAIQSANLTNMNDDGNIDATDAWILYNNQNNPQNP